MKENHAAAAHVLHRSWERQESRVGGYLITLAQVFPKTSLQMIAMSTFWRGSTSVIESHCISPFPITETKYPTPTTERRGGLFWLPVLVDSVHGRLSPGQKQHGSTTWKKKAAHSTVARKQREGRSRLRRPTSKTHPSDLPLPVRLHFWSWDFGGYFRSKS